MMGTACQPGWRRCLSKVRGVLLHNDFTFKIQARIEAVIFMGIAGVAINATVLAPLVWVHGKAKAEVGAVYLLLTIFWPFHRIFVSLGFL